MSATARVESATESTAVAYPLRSPAAQLLNNPAARAAIEPMLRPGESYDRIIVEVYHAAVKNPEILKCTGQSIVSAVARAVQTGLIIGETVHLVPFGAQLQAILDYKGSIQLCLTAGAARYIDAQCVYANEPFEYEQGMTPKLRHVPVVDPKKRGELLGAYAIAKVTRDDVRIVFMSVEEIDGIRLSKSKSWKTGKLSAIPWYALKTVIRRLTKTLPKNPELAKVVAILDRDEDEALAETVDADLAHEELAAPTASRRIGPGIEAMETAPAKADSDGVALATTEQKIEIVQLLDRVDLDEPRRVAYATTAGASAFTHDDAVSMIGELRRLIPPLEEQEQANLI